MRVLPLLFLLVSSAYASEERRPRQDVDVNVNTPVDVNTPVSVEAPVDVDVTSPVNVNTQTTLERNQVRQVPDAFFNYTPNYVACGRTIGLQWGSTSGVGSLGIPAGRSRACDLWLAVNEAQENGHILPRS